MRNFQTVMTRWEELTPLDRFLIWLKVILLTLPLPAIVIVSLHLTLIFLVLYSILN